MRTLSSSPPSKRLKLESLSPTRTLENHEERSFSEEIADAEQEHQCSICLEVILDRTVIPTCSHEFCFECLLVWSGVQYSLFSLLKMTHPRMIYRTIKTMPIMLASHWTVCYSQHQVKIRLPQTLSNPVARISRTSAGVREGGSGTYPSKAYCSRKRTGYEDERRKRGK
jgi:hypothetical protein